MPVPDGPTRSATAGVALLAGTVCLVAVVAGQQPQPTFRTTVTHVQIDVVVTDRRDRPVTDLTAADFEVRERGHLQTIADFEHVSVPLAERPVDLAAPQPPPPDVVSNAPPAPTARAFVFVLDDATLETQWIVPIKRWMTMFLGTLHPEDRVAMVYVSRSDLSQDFTNDMGSLVRSVNGLTAAMKAGASTCRSTVPTLRNVVASVASAPEGRRAVIFVSEKFPRVGVGYACVGEVAALIEDATRAGVPIYTFHPVGLSAPELGLDLHLEDQTPENRAALDHEVTAGKEGLLELAMTTGGRGFVYQSDSPRAIRALMTENGSYYLLGYYPSPDVADGRFHDVDVRVRRPGVRVRSRAGYLARAPASAGPARLADALKDGVPGGDLIVHAVAAPLAMSDGRSTVFLTLDVDYPGNAAAVTRDDDLEFAWMALDADAKVKGSGQNAFRVPSARITRQALTVTVNDALVLPKGTAVVRAVVSSRSLGKRGIVHVPVRVTDPPRDRLWLTPVVIGTSVGPERMVVALGRSASLLPFQPSTSRRFVVGQAIHVFARAFTPRGRTLEGRLTIKRGDEVVRRTALHFTGSTSGTSGFDCPLTVRLDDLPAGDYVLELTVGDGRDTATRAVPFAVAPATPPWPDY